jgi:tRNA U34 5-carboxymethylaminomethyl modifying GTPase MnmE/TrmE
MEARALHSDTIAAVATGAQLSAVGILRLSGPEAIALADRLFEPMAGAPLAAREDRRLVYGRLRTRAGEVLDLDAYTGGFNLQIAWSTGYVAGNSV